MILFLIPMINLNQMTTYSNKLYICEHAKSGKCSGVFHDTGTCSHQILHQKRKFIVGCCDEKDKIYCSEAKNRGLKNPRTCVPQNIIEEIIDNKLFEI